MGLEPAGYTPRHKEILWIEPVEYQGELEEAVEIFTTRGMNVSIYNSQPCLLRRSLWKFARSHGCRSVNWPVLAEMMNLAS